MDFTPEYFHAPKTPIHSFIIDNCIAAFGNRIDIKNPHQHSASHLFVYDQTIPTELINSFSNTIMSMDVLAITFDFQDVVNVKLQKDNCPFPLAVRKLYALTYFMMQITWNDPIFQSFFSQMRVSFEILNSGINQTDLSSKSSLKGIQSASAACCYAMSLISKRFSQMLSILNEDYFFIVSSLLSISTINGILDDNTTSIFFTFFLTSILAFPSDIILNDLYKNLLMSLLDICQKSINKIDVSNTFNYPSLCKKLISFLSHSDFPIETKLRLYNFLLDLSYQQEHLSAFLFNEENVNHYTNFLVETTKTLDKEMNYDYIFKTDYDGIHTSGIIFDQIIHETTFTTPFSCSNLTLSEKKEKKSQFMNNESLSTLFQTTFTLCNSDPENRFTNHSNLLMSIMKAPINPTIAVFISIWFKRYILMDPDEAYKSFHSINVIDYMLQLSDAIKIIEYNDNLYETLVFMSKNCRHVEFLEELLNQFETHSLNLTIDYEFIGCIIQCSKTDQKKVAYLMKKIIFDQKISNIVLKLRSYHTAINNTKEILDAVLKAREIIFYFIEKVFEFETIRNFFLLSTVFIETLCQMIFEPMLQDYVFKLIEEAITTLKSRDSQLNEIILFFQALMTRTNEPEIVALDKTILKNIPQYFAKNSNECAIVFIQTRFFITLSTFVTFTKDKDDLFCLFKIFESCTLLQSQVMEYLLEMNPFKVVASLLQSEFVSMDSIQDYLWSITCGTECKFMDQVRIIKNPIPLSLLFRSMMSTKETMTCFIKFIYQCSEKNLNSAVEVTKSEIPSLLIGIIQKYRQDNSIDELFKYSLDLLSVLSKNYMKSKDLLALFQSLTLIPGKNARPFYTIQVLNTLKKIISGQHQTSTSFLQFDANNSKVPLIQLPDVPIASPFSNCSIFVTIKFSKFKPKTKCEILQMKTMPDFTLTIYQFNNKLFLSLQKGQQSFEKTIPFTLEYDVWIQLSFFIQNSVFHAFLNENQILETKIPPFEFSTQIHSSFLVKNIRCNFSSFYFLSCPVNSKIIQLLSKLPRISPTTFQSSDADEFPHQFRKLFDNAIAKNSIFLYNAASTYDNILPNLAENFTLYQATFTGKLFHSLPPIKNLLHCVGGIPIIFPLFNQLDQPFDPELLPTIISLLTLLLANSSVNQEEFYQSNGCQIISYLISCSTLANITEEFIDKLIDMFNTIDYPALIKQMFKSLFFNLQLWVYLSLDMQIYINQQIIKLFDSMPIEKKKLILTILHFRDVVMLMRVCLWETNSLPNICLLDKPKINLTTKEVESERPTYISEVRKLVWEFAWREAFVVMSKRDVEILFVYSFETHDIKLSIEMLQMIIRLIVVRNQTMLETLKLYYSFKEFFPLMLMHEELLRIHCILLLMQFSQPDLIHLLGNYTAREWVTTICQYIVTKNTTNKSIDVVFGYILGIEQPTFELITSQSISGVENNDNKHFSIKNYNLILDEDAPIVKNYFLIPLALVFLSEYPDDQSKVYVSLLDKSIRKSLEKGSDELFKAHDWFYSFLLIIITRMVQNKMEVDATTKILIQLVGKLFEKTIIAHQSCNILKKTRIFLTILSRTKSWSLDLSVIYKMILTQVAEDFIQNEHLNEVIIAKFVKSLFLFLFFIPSTESYYLPPFPSISDVTISDSSSHDSQDFSNAEKLSQTSALTYQKAAYVLRHIEKFNFKFAFATRTDIDGHWLDSRLGVILCQFYQIYPALGTKIEKFLPIFSVTLNAGLSHFDTFEQFVSYIEVFTNFIPVVGTRFGEYESFILLNYMSGLLKVYMRTDHHHESHFYMFKDTQLYSNALIEYGKIPPNTFDWNLIENSGESKIQGFDNYIKNDKRGQNYVYLLIEKSIDNETTYSANRIGELVKSINQYFQKFVEQRKVLEKPINLETIRKRNRNVLLQLRRYALNVKHSKSKGLKKYVEFWRALSSERGAWSPPETVYTHHWKLNKMIQNTLTRGLLTENFHFDDHKEASLLRDVGNPSDAAEGYQKHLKKLRITNFTGDDPVLTLMTDVGDAQVSKDKGKIKNEDVLFTIDAKLVTMRNVISGTFMLTDKYVIFDSDQYKEIKLDAITAIFCRRYLLFDTSIEFYTIDHFAYFFDFAEGQRNHVIQTFVKLKNQNLMPELTFLQTSEKSVHQLVHHVQMLWQEGMISNFDYLMLINIASGRTYNDLSQYPVFPWILSNYESSTIDLNDPDNYRDLTVPIGAYTKDRLNAMKQRMKIACTPEDYYLYGSFYSSAAVVIGYLIRMEPFTSFHINLQSGRFDNPDRLFKSIPRTWNSVTTLSMDFRELIPEFFFLPDFLINSNHFDLGSNTNDVELPKWAKTPREFIDINRRALESPIVSQNLPRWIDMVFGVTSRGNHALKINNVFNPLFFDNHLTQDVKGNDERKVFRTEFAACFGQAPHQIFEHLHPDRFVTQRSLKPNSVKTLFNCTSKPVLSLEIIEDSFDVSSQHDQNMRAMRTSTINTAALPHTPSLKKMRNSSSSNSLSSMSQSRSNDRLNNVNQHQFIHTDNRKRQFTIILINTDFEVFILDQAGKVLSKSKLPQLLTNTINTMDDVEEMTRLIKTYHKTIIHASQFDCSFEIGHLVKFTEKIGTAATAQKTAINRSNCNVNPQVQTQVNTADNNALKNVGITPLPRLDSESSLSTKDQFPRLHPSNDELNNLDRTRLPNSPSDTSLNTQHISIPFPNNTNFIQRIRYKRSSDASLSQLGQMLLYEKKQVKRINARKVSCIAISEHRYAIGSHDNTVMVWENTIDKPQIPLTIFSKHRSSVNSVDLNESCNILVSTSRDGSIVTCSLMNNKFIKMISVGEIGDPISAKISNFGTICVCIVKADKSLVKVYDVNLNEINEHLFESRIRVWTLFQWYDNQEYLSVGMRNKTVAILSLPTFKNVWNNEGENFDVSSIEVATYSKVMIFTSFSGDVMSIDLENLDHITTNDERYVNYYEGEGLQRFEDLDPTEEASNTIPASADSSESFSKNPMARRIVTDSDSESD